jgi:murein DD-endopeptidase MepM/ murein hydrolase activator NlpD
MPTGPQQQEIPVTKTVGDVFTTKNLWLWFSSTPTQYFDGQNERGQDYSTTFGTPVGVPVGGKIVRIVHNNNAINDVVELQDSSGAVWLYQHITAKVSVGDTLGCGGVIGTENGLPIDQYSTGPHIEVRYCPAGKWSISTDSWTEPWVNPRAIFAALATQQAGLVDTGASLLPTLLNGILSKIQLAPDASVAELLYSMDVALELTNPFNVQNVQQDSVLGVTFTDPVAWAGDVGMGMIQDLSALIVRAAFITIGLFIIYAIGFEYVSNAMGKAVNQVLEPVGGVQGAVKLAGAFV